MLGLTLVQVTHEEKRLLGLTPLLAAVSSVATGLLTLGVFIDIAPRSQVIPDVDSAERVEIDCSIETGHSIKSRYLVSVSGEVRSESTINWNRYSTYVSGFV